MRVGVDLRHVTDPVQRRALAVEADELGLWAVLIGGDGPGTEATDAARLAAVTRDVHLLLWFSEVNEHPFTLCEEATIVDHLSHRRAGVVVAPGAVTPGRPHDAAVSAGTSVAADDSVAGERDARPDDSPAGRMRRWLAGEIINGVALTPPPAQSRLPVWWADPGDGPDRDHSRPAAIDAGDVAVPELQVFHASGDLEADRPVIDAHRDAGWTHLIVRWPGPLPVLARHLMTRAVGPGFPDVVAEMADRLPVHEQD